MSESKNKSPWAWIPTLYFAEGIPYVVAMSLVVVMYKRLGISNTDIALYTSWLYLPWVIKPFWSPFVDMMKTKRWWIVTMQLLIGACLGGVAFLIPVPFFFQATLAVLWLMAFSSATHDIAADGFYMLALDSSQQSFFVGIRSTFYRLAMITGQGLLIILAGSLESFTGLQPLNFSVESSTTAKSTIVMQPQNYNVPKTDEMTFVAFPSDLVLNTNRISKDSLEQIKNIASAQNLQNGFVSADKNSAVKAASKEMTGNAGIVAIRLTKKPEAGKSVVLNTNFAKGDKSISVVSGERITFTPENWDKPAYVVVQLDKKLSSNVKSEFKGVSGNLKLAWSITFFILAGFFVLLFVYHRFVLPRPASDHSTATNSVGDIFKEFGHTFATFFQKPGIVLAIFFMLTYRLGEAMLVKIVSPFLLDGREVGGLGLTTGQVGLVYGTVGVLALTLGGITGGIAASRKGLKYWIWPMAMSITLPQCAYIFLSTFLPDNFFFINLAVAVEQFGYGFGFTAYMLYMIYFSDGEHKTAHYAICTAFMALGMMLPGMMAGWLQEKLGYQHYFFTVMLAIIPCYLAVSMLKIDPEFGKKKKN
ncbi:MFS transporter [Paludibacter jiangxiensis]|uniref:MFS transporter, PAT family n=1 Tax=Paludibacter jiangxiensis TaxID=681398 RepID=A0A161LCW7_9BACT|nr:MFS transporter [Paludibacter jiangxiensis]GAT61815.1 MFS transporter, PAT family [Paludibacter jiangxiensis]